MIEEVARIVDIDDVTHVKDFPHVWVETERKTACGSCASSKGCGTSALADAFGTPKARIRVSNPSAAGLGDLVVIGIPEAALSTGTLVMYGLPLLGIMLGALLFGSLPTLLGGEMYSDGYTIPGALLGLWGGFFLARRHHCKSIVVKDGQSGVYEPVVLRKMTDAPVVFDL